MHLELFGRKRERPVRGDAGVQTEEPQFKYYDVLTLSGLVLWCLRTPGDVVLCVSAFLRCVAHYYCGEVASNPEKGCHDW